MKKTRKKRAGSLSKLKYWFDKLPELNRNIEPLTHLMVRTARETNNYLKNHNFTIKTIIINSKDINLLHSIDRKPALNKLFKKNKFLKNNKINIKKLEKENGYIDLTSPFFTNSPFKSINHELVVEITKHNYLTISGVGRIGALKITFPEGINIKIKVGIIDDCLKKRLVAINNLYIYSNRFSNLKIHGINEKEIPYCKFIKTKKCYRRGKFIKKQRKKFETKLRPLL